MRPGNWLAGSCPLELNELSAARADKHLPALTVFIPGDGPVQKRSAINRGDHRDGSHLVCLQPSKRCFGCWIERDAPKDCFLLQGLHLLPSPSLRLTLTVFHRFWSCCLPYCCQVSGLFFFIAPCFFFPPSGFWVFPRKWQGHFMLQLLLAPLVPSRWRESALIPVFLPLCTHRLVG